MKTLIKLFLISIFLLTMQSVVLAKSCKFIQITDVHYSKSDSNDKVLSQAVENLNSMNDIDFIMFSGDVIDVSGEKDLISFCKVVKKLNKPYYILIGNHDVFKYNGLSKEQFMKIVKKNSSVPYAKPNYIFKKDNIVFIAVDGAKEVMPSAAGYYKEDTLKWLDSKLTKYKNSPVIIFQHFPLVFDENIYRGHRTYKNETYLEMLSKHDNVVAVFTGHLHVDYEKEVDGVQHIITTAFVHAGNPARLVDLEKNPDSGKKNKYKVYSQIINLK